MDGRRMMKVMAGVIAAGLACSIAGTLGGCATYANYPARGEDDPAINDPNTAPSPEVVQVALKRMIATWPVDGAYVINLPQGMSKRRADEIVRNLKDPNANMVSLATAGLPAYHVTRVWIRPGARAQVEILRPVFGIGGRDEGALYQPVTLKLRRSPLEPWRVDAVRVWPIGQAEPPEMFGWPENASEQPVAEPTATPAATPEAAPTGG